MPIHSYAQNFEDVMLWRALGHVEGGQYIDVGAQSPVIDSVSMAFYEKGWRGIHVEPSSGYAQALREARPDERVIQAALGAAPGTLPFFEIPDTGLSTLDREVAEAHRARGFAIREVPVPVLTLDDVLEIAGPQIHWLKIDVEGAEADVLRGWTRTDRRPWVVVVESTQPLGQQPSHESWEPLLLGMGYRFVHFDGLNRFYLSPEHPELAPHFACGPNCFDAFTLSGTATSTFAALLLGQLHDAHARARHAEAEAALRAEELQAFEARRLREATEREQHLANLRQEALASDAEHQRQLREGERAFAALEREFFLARERALAEQAEHQRLLREGAERHAELERSLFRAREQGLAERIEHERQLREQQQAYAGLERGMAATSAYAQSLEGLVERLREENGRLQDSAETLSRQVRLAEQRVSELHASTSWRVTAPMRIAVLALRRLPTMLSIPSLRRRASAGKLRLKIWLKPRLLSGIQRVEGVPVLARLGRTLVARLPRLRGRLQRMRGAPPLSEAPVTPGEGELPTAAIRLSRRARLAALRLGFDFQEKDSPERS